MARQTFRRNWPTTFYMLMIIFHCMIYSCFAKYTFTDPMPVAVTEGQTALLTCAWTPRLDDGHIARWHFFTSNSGDEAIENSDTKYALSNELTTSSLWITSFSQSDVGRYRCEVGNGINGFIYVSRDVEVGMLLCLPGNGEGELGTVPLCSSSFSDFDLLWYRNEEPLSDIGLPSQSGLYLYARSLTMEDDGAVFTCRARWNDNSVIGICETTPLILTIDARIEKTPPGLLQVGDNFNLTCLVNGDPDEYEYRWMYGPDRVLDATTTGKMYAIGDKENVVTFRDVKSSVNDKNITCTVSRPNRVSTVASFIIELQTTTTDLPTTTTDMLTTTAPSLSTSQIFHSPTSGSNLSQDSSSITIIVIGVVAIILVILATILIICFLVRRRKKQYRNMTKPESVPLEEPSYDNIKEKPTSPDSRNMSDKNVENDPVRNKLITDSTVYHEPRSLNSNADLNNPESLYAEPDMPADDGNGQFGSKAVSYDTPRKTVSLDNIDAPKQGTSLSVDDMSELYAKPNKSSSRESIDAMYAKPNKTHSRENIDELYSKPNKSAANTPKAAHKDPTHKNVEGLTYADIEFQGDTFPSPAPKDYGLDYASVQFNN